MTTPAHTRAVAEVLVQHPSIPGRVFEWQCPTCRSRLDGGPNSPVHAQHQADALAAAGLLADPDALAAAEAEVERLRAVIPREDGGPQGCSLRYGHDADCITSGGVTCDVANALPFVPAWKHDALAARNTALREAVEARCAQIEAMPIPADPGMSQTEITGRIVATIVKVIRAALAVDGAGQEGRHG